MNQQNSYPNKGYMQAGGFPNNQYPDPTMNNNCNTYNNNMQPPNRNMYNNCPPPDMNNNYQQNMNCQGNPPYNNNFNNNFNNNIILPDNNYQQNNNYTQQNNMNNNFQQPMMNNYQQPNSLMQQQPMMNGNMMNNYQQNNVPPPMDNTQMNNNFNNYNNNISMQPMVQQAYTQSMPGQLAKANAGMAAPGLIQGPTLTKFFVDIKKRLNRDYIVIMDMSGSMRGQKWEQAKMATMKIAPFACQADPDGITLYLFSSQFTKYQNLRRAEQVQEIFNREKPSGRTNMVAVLQSAFNDHFSGNKPTTILFVTDGGPDSQTRTTKEIIAATSRLSNNDELSISFIQIGNDARATQYLRFLDDSLMSQGAKFDIVDTVTSMEAGSMTFDQLVQKSIYD